MVTQKNRLKKTLILTALIAMNMTCSFAHAADTTDEEQAKGETKTEFYLRLIAKYTRSAMTSLDAWVLPDESKPESASNQLRKQFESINTSRVKNAKTQYDTQLPLTGWFLASRGNVSYTPFYINDFTYQSILTPSTPVDMNDPRLKGNTKPDLAMNYIQNAAGLNIFHKAPSKEWPGTDESKEAYKNYFTTVSSIQSFNGYVLSGLYANAKNGNQLTVQQNALMTMASNSTWFSEVAGEKIGTVLRQILMFNSQMFVLMTQLLEIQKQALAAQAMTNTLLVIGNRFTESQLYTKATNGGML